ncbi:hypothetical protein K457DRAFT_129181 [Linnemannia elongata AG-77]|uniref:C3H1-type domain-containing protein n=1 Tax=Linnemannia elongata AG-77 TaxID=1314771 RepID=A0A197JJQ0_9FUNG|nr:hypothetical protein K457DRAFT_129181 [Linnemannia elongata AG-77]
MLLDDSSDSGLKEFLTKELAQISDADPAMLADYIIALLKHDKENDELKELCVSQLDDFLQQETVPFVDLLFEALATKSYRSNGSGAAASAPRSYGGSSSGSSADRTSHQRQEKHHRGDSDGSDDEDRSYKHARRDDTRDVSSSITSSSNNTNNINNNGRRREYSPSRPSDDNRSDSRRGGRSHDSNASGQSDSDRRGDRSSQGGFSRQQGLTTAGFNNRNNGNNSNNSNAGDRGQWNGGQQRNQFQDGGRGNFQDQQGNGSWRGGANNMRGGRGGMQGGPGFGQDRPKRQRCRDYDEKGFCMRGDMCPYDHGDDRIVVDEMAQVPFGMMGVPGMGPNTMMAMGGMGGIGGMGRPPFFPGMPSEIITPHGSDMYDADGAPLSETMGASKFPTDSSESWRSEGGGRFDSTRGGARGRGSLRGMRGGRGRGGSSHPYAVPGRFGAGGSSGGAAGSKTSLVVENIPDEFNTIDKVNEFFKTFGSLTNIQVDQAAHKALIQYSTRDEASAAYNSPEVIFGNRFVKVYWQPDDLDSATFGRQPKPTGQVRPETPAAGASHYPLPPATSVLMTPERAAELAEERAAAAAKKEENKKTMLEIQRQKEALAQRQQEEQKLLMQALLAKKNMSQKDKDEILSGLKNVAIEITKEAVDPHAQARAAATAAEAQRQAELQKEAERLEKARLDTELEVLNTTPSASGTTDAAETTAALKAKLAALQAQAAALGLEHQGGYAGRGRGGYVPRGRGRGAPVNSWTRGGGRGGAIVSHHRTFRIDNRSTKLSVQNVDDLSKEGLREHFETFGEVESFSLGADGASATVQFKNRKDAEIAMQQGSQTANAAAGPLKLNWISEPQQAPVTSAAPSYGTGYPKASTPVASSVAAPVSTTVSDDADAVAAAAAAAAGNFGESDDEEHGERSWKR